MRKEKFYDSLFSLAAQYSGQWLPFCLSTRRSFLPRLREGLRQKESDNASEAWQQYDFHRPLS